MSDHSKNTQTKVCTRTLFAHEIADFKQEYPKSHVGSYPQPHHVGPMKWIYVYSVEQEIT